MVLRLRVSAGPSHSEQTVLNVNDEGHPLEIDSPHWRGRILVRVRDFVGLPPEQKHLIQTTEYFDGNRDQYSIQIQGRFKKQWTADDILFGNDFDRPLRLPPFSSVALAIARRIDPGLEADVFCDKPWAHSPLFVTMNTLNVRRLSSPTTDSAKSNDIEFALPPWPTGLHIEEDAKELTGVLLSSAERRRVLADPTRRKQTSVTEDIVFNADFFNPYVDMNACAILLPGFSVSVLRYWDGQPLRYVAKSRDKTAVFFVVTFELIEVEEEKGEEGEEGEEEGKEDGEEGEGEGEGEEEEKEEGREKECVIENVD